MICPKKILLLASGFWLLASPLSAAISHTGSCANNSTSCTLSATATGDLKVVYAVNSTAATIPTLASGWTLIESKAGAGQVTMAEITACQVASSSSDTGTGTWTNATLITGISYAGTNVGTTANCNTTGVGGHSFASANASTTMNYQTITMSGTISWVNGSAAGSASSTCVPSGMTQVTGSSSGITANDTNGIVSSWATTGCTVTSEKWIEETIEILGKPAAVTCALSTALLGVGCR